MQIDQLNHVALHVADVEASIRFYRDVLGLEELPRPAFNFPGAWLRIGPGNSAQNGVQELHLIQRAPKETEDYSFPRERHYAMRVVEIEAAAARLREHNVQFEGPHTRPDGAKQIFFRDPDQHRVELCWLPAAGG